MIRTISPGKKWLNLEEIANKAILVSLEPQSYVEYLEKSPPSGLMGKKVVDS